MTLSARDEIYMQRCLELASNGLGLTRQNPLVGSVVVYNDRIIGEGYHNEYGGPHAEVNAINSIADKSLLKKSTLYVNLEPCAHFGKTPPCSMMIKDSGIPRVIIGSKDSNPDVSGKGIEILESGGAEVITGVLEKECRMLNRRFFTFHEQKRPFVILKWAQTKDGFIDIIRDNINTSDPAWITNHTSRMLVHKWRSEELSIMAGTDTILLDNPELNVREWPGIDPVRIVPDKKGRLFKGLKVLDGLSPTIVLSGLKNNNTALSNYLHLHTENFEIPAILNQLYKIQIMSVFVEGGARLLQSFINSGLWDESFVFFGNKMFVSGVKAPVLNCEPCKKTSFRGIKIYFYMNDIIRSGSESFE
jgi:diaminohydroxyphosphoribosylaminopyrimidine deaminase / 5-amino-6-(5-phosphoribosylamino)uracil reductase